MVTSARADWNNQLFYYVAPVSEKTNNYHSGEVALADVKRPCSDPDDAILEQYILPLWKTLGDSSPKTTPLQRFAPQQVKGQWFRFESVDGAVIEAFGPSSPSQNSGTYTVRIDGNYTRGSGEKRYYGRIMTKVIDKR
ncbi:MAG: hypothetical protein ABIC95_06790 [archaeon]